MLSNTGRWLRAELGGVGGERRGERGGGRAGESLIPRPISRFCRSRAGSDGTLKPFPLPPPLTALSGEQLPYEDVASDSPNGSWE